MPRTRERSIRVVPAAVMAGLVVVLVAQVALSVNLGRATARAEDLPVAPPLSALQLASLGEPTATGKLLMLWLQAFDYQSGTGIPYRNLDYGRLESWLERILALDPAGQYPLLSASRLYAEVADPVRQRRMLDFIHRQYLLDPDRRWPAMAHATVLAKHRLKDLPLARRYAVDLEHHTKARDVPVWVTQMEAFILEDMNELEAARILIGGLIASGRVHDQRDLELLRRRLEVIERQQAVE